MPDTLQQILEDIGGGVFTNPPKDNRLMNIIKAIDACEGIEVPDPIGKLMSKFYVVLRDYVRVIEKAEREVG